MANNKIQIDKEKLKKLYLEDNLSMEKISKILNVSRNAIRNRIIEYGFCKTIVKKEIPKNELYELYINKNLTVKEISEIYNVSIKRINRELSKNNIKKSKDLFYAKVKQIVKDKYGVDNISQLEDVKCKKEQQAIDRFGVNNISKSNIIKEKKEKKAIDKFGVKCVLQCESVKKKIKQSIKGKYGVEYPQQNKEIQEKTKKTNIKRYGVEYPGQSKSIKAKIKETNIKKYGVGCILNSKEVKDKILKTKKERYGYIYNFQVPSIKEKIKKTCMERYGVPYACMTNQCRKANGNANSKINQNFSKKLTELGIKNKMEKPLANYSYDIEIIDKRILLEINPTYTHNCTYGSQFRGHQKNPLKKDYHYNKTQVAKNNGYQCIHIWDWDDQKKILNMLKLRKNIYARNCKIAEISLEKCADFLNNYHLQGNCKGQIKRYGLFYDDELVQVMTFGKPRYNPKYEWELLRLCSKNEYTIIGGASRLFEKFLNECKPNNIISYCDNSKFNGEVYKNIGFKLLDYGKPSKHWYNMKTKQHITDNLLRQRGFDQLFKTNYGKGTSNEQLMIQNGFVEIFDCGQSVYKYETK